MGFLHLLNPFALLTGVVSVAMTVAHGAIYLAAKSRGKVQHRALLSFKVAAIVWALLFADGLS